MCLLVWHACMSWLAFHTYIRSRHSMCQVGPMCLSVIRISGFSSRYLITSSSLLSGATYPYIFVCCEEVIHGMHLHVSRRSPWKNFPLHILSSVKHSYVPYVRKTNPHILYSVRQTCIVMLREADPLITHVSRDVPMQPLSYVGISLCSRDAVPRSTTFL